MDFGLAALILSVMFFIVFIALYTVLNNKLDNEIDQLKVENHISYYNWNLILSKNDIFETDFVDIVNNHETPLLVRSVQIFNTSGEVSKSMSSRPIPCTLETNDTLSLQKIDTESVWQSVFVGVDDRDVSQKFKVVLQNQKTIEIDGTYWNQQDQGYYFFLSNVGVRANFMSTIAGWRD